MLRAIGARHLPRERRLVVCVAPKFLKGESDSLYIVLARIAHETDEGPRVDTGRQKRADRDVCHEMMSHAVKQGRAHTRHTVLGLRRVATSRLGLAVDRCNGVIALGRMHTYSIDHSRAPR